MIGSADLIKPYHEMTDSERLVDRIARNRRAELRSTSGNAGLSLEGILARLDAGKQRATYGAVADLVGVPHRSLMSGRPHTCKDSWIVAGTGSKRGWPTKYSKNQIHPDCYQQICDRVDDFIDSSEALKQWLEPRT